MDADASFIDIEVREGPLFRKVKATKRLHLPLSWQANRKSWKPLALPLFLMLFVLFGAGLISNGWLLTGVACTGYFALLVYIVGRSRLTLLKIGPGRVTLYADGFSDDRLGPERIRWHHLQAGLTRRTRSDGPPIGVSLRSDRDIGTTGATVDYDDYKRAYYMIPLKTNRLLHIDFAGEKNGAEIEKAIRALVEAAKPGSDRATGPSMSEHPPTDGGPPVRADVTSPCTAPSAPSTAASSSRLRAGSA